jgi:hypothetical protein
MLPLYMIAIFLSAALLFVVQPLFARFALPLLGGSPAVWNTALVFYQAALLVGYAYAHFSTRWLGPRRQAALHAALLALPLLALPIGIPAGWLPPGSGSPIPWLLSALLVGVGLPFIVVSATSPLLQRWFAASGHPHGADPYFLYGASNAGSMLALLAYPLLLEPSLRLHTQSALWSWGYGLLAALLVGCAIVLWRRPRVAAAEAASGATAQPLAARRVGRWVLLALVPSALLSSVTSYLSTDIAAIPLLWVLPLALYLLTFVIVFARRPIVPHWLVLRALPLAVLPLTIILVLRFNHPLELLIPIHLLVFLVVTLACHGELARDRPPPAQLTAFYLWQSLGGVLGGALVALVAPLVFTSVVEYPLMLVLACALIPLGRDEGKAAVEGAEPSTAPSGVGSRLPLFNIQRSSLAADLLLPTALGLLSAGSILGVRSIGLGSGVGERALVFGVPVLLCFSMSRRPVRFALGVAALLLAGQMYPAVTGSTLYAERTFFGVNRVQLTSDGSAHLLFHGSTLHGTQLLAPEARRVPVSYYYPTGPIGQVFSARPGLRSVAVVGLGTGSLACYRAPGQRWTYYEIDPAVARIARDPSMFTYMSECDPQANIVLGDARLMLAQTDETYDLIVLDAYSSDSIPVHLLTREALGVYLKRLNPGGLLAFHISNRQLNLKPVLAALAADSRLVALMNDDFAISDEDGERGKSPSQWVALARGQEDLTGIAGKPGWQADLPFSADDLWTDDYSSLLRVIAWR